MLIINNEGKMKQYKIKYCVVTAGTVHVSAESEAHARRFAEFRFNPHYLSLTDAEICEESEGDGEGRLTGAVEDHSIDDWHIRLRSVETVAPGEGCVPHTGFEPETQVQMLPVETARRSAAGSIAGSGAPDAPGRPLTLSPDAPAARPEQVTPAGDHVPNHPR